MEPRSQHQNTTVPKGRIEHSKDALENELQAGGMSIEDKRALHDAREAFSHHLDAMDEETMPARETPDLEEGYDIATSRLENLLEGWYNGKDYKEIPVKVDFVEHLREFVDIYEETFNRYEGTFNQYEGGETDFEDYLTDEDLMDSFYKDAPSPEDGNLF